MTPDAAIAKLRSAGFPGFVGDIRLERRGEFWLAALPSERAIAWFPTTTDAIEVLRKERRVLELVAKHCSFEVPRSVLVDPAEHVDVRTCVEGLADHTAIFKQLRSDSDLAVRFGVALGAILADLHHSVPTDSCADWLPSRLEWPLPRSESLANLRILVDDSQLVQRANMRISAHPDHRFRSITITRFARPDHGFRHRDHAFR